MGPIVSLVATSNAGVLPSAVDRRWRMVSSKGLVLNFFGPAGRRVRIRRKFGCAQNPRLSRHFRVVLNIIHARQCLTLLFQAIFLKRKYIQVPSRCCMHR